MYQNPIGLHLAFLCFCLGLLAWGPTGVQGPRLPAGVVSRSQRIDQEIDWILSSVRSDGAIALTPEKRRIQPYFANLAARALLVSKTKHAKVVKNWMIWYFAHLNRPDRWSLHGTIYDFDLDSSGKLKSTSNYDSSDSYAATFLSLAWNYLQVTQDSQFVIENLSSLMSIANAIRGTLSKDGLTAAKPDYPIIYSMDNVEVWKGISEFESLLLTIGKNKEAAEMNALAAKMESAIENELWDSSKKRFRVHQLESAQDRSSFYPHETAQLWPVINGLPLATKNAKTLWKNFTENNPNWMTITADPFPWTALAIAGLEAKEFEVVDRYVEHLDTRLLKTRKWPWHIGESAGLILVFEKRDQMLPSNVDTCLSGPEIIGTLNEVSAAMKPLIQAHPREIEIHYRPGELPLTASVNGWKYPKMQIEVTGKSCPEGLSKDGLRAMICHEFGHIGGGAPTRRFILGELSVEGQADFFAAAVCLPTLFRIENNETYSALVKSNSWLFQICGAANRSSAEIAVCGRVAMAALNLTRYLFQGWDTKFNGRGPGLPPEIESTDGAIVERTFVDYPTPQCRLDTYKLGAKCMISPSSSITDFKNAHTACGKSAGDIPRPSCWYKRTSENP